MKNNKIADDRSGYPKPTESPLLDFSANRKYTDQLSRDGIQ